MIDTETSMLHTTDNSPGKIIDRSLGMLEYCRFYQSAEELGRIIKYAKGQLCEKALEIGADAVVGVAISSSGSDPNCLLVISGTAVTVKGSSRDEDNFFF